MRTHITSTALAVFSVLLLPFFAFAGSKTYSTPGTYTFTVPNYSGTLIVEAWGGGQETEVYSAVVGNLYGKYGGSSSFNGTVIAGGGGGPIPGFAHDVEGGIASGGDVNIRGERPTQNSAMTYAIGGSAPNGGHGGLWPDPTTNPNTMGQKPGGGGGYSGCIWGLTACIGGASGGYVKKTYAVGGLASGADIPVVVGAGGKGTVTFWGSYPALAGGDGMVRITWDDVAPPPPITLSCAFSFDANPIKKGNATKINWTTTGGTSFRIDGIGGGLPPSGSTSISPSKTTTYTGTVYKCPAGTTLNVGGTQCVRESSTRTYSTIPLYEFEDAGGWHSRFYTGAKAEKDLLIAGSQWRYLGIAAYALPPTYHPAGTVPMRRFYSRALLNSHFYTTSDTEARAILAQGYVEELEGGGPGYGTGGYVYPPGSTSRPADTVPLYRTKGIDNPYSYTLSLSPLRSGGAGLVDTPSAGSDESVVIAYVYSHAKSFTVSNDDGSGIAPETSTCSATLTVNEGSGPTAPSITAGGACVLGTPYSVALRSTSPTGARLRYVIDWNADFSIEGFLPASGFAPSGTSLSTSTVFTVPGTRYIAASAQDENGLRSATTTFSFSCSGACTPTPGPRRCADGVSWTTDGCAVFSCGAGYACTDPGGVCSPSCAPVARRCIDSTHWTDDSCGTAHECASGTNCTDPGGICSAACPRFQHRGSGGQCVCSDGTLPINGSCGGIIQTFTVKPLLVRQGEKVKVSWSTVHVASCTVTGTNGDRWTGVLGTNELSGRINAQTIYTLSCVGLDEVSLSQRKIVNIVPKVKEL